MRTTVSASRHIATGVLAFSLAELAWLAIRLFTGTYTRWVMEPTAGIALAVSFIGGATILATRGATVRAAARTGALLLVGVLIAVICWLLLIGPGNLWPLAIAIDFVIAGVTVAAAALLALATRRLSAGIMRHSEG